MTRKQKKVLLRIILCGVTLIGATVADGMLKPEWYVSLALFAVPYLIIGYDVLCKALINILRGNVLDEQFLMAVATVGAFAIQENVEASAVMLFYQVGELFQSIAVGKSRRSIAELMSIRPDCATVEADGKETVLSPEEVAVGQIIVVRPGERIALDGVITEGHTIIDTSSLTGESLPLERTEGQTVLAGSINVEGVIRVRVTGAYETSTVAKILELVESATDKKAKTEGFITSFARFYTPVVCISALLLAVLPPLLGFGAFSEWVRRALVFLVVSCPCALVVSVPLSFFGGIGGASRRGILIKGAEYVETLARTDIFVLDKTGTLTTGSFGVDSVSTADNVTEEELLRIAALCEAHSSHPLAVSIVADYQKRYGSPGKASAENVRELAGSGVCATVDGRRYFVGNANLMKDVLKDKFTGAEAAQGSGTDVFVAVSDGIGSGLLGRITLKDTVKKGAKSAIKELRAVGIKKTVMLTGDREAVASELASGLGLDEYRSRLLPSDKVTALEELMMNMPSSRSRIAFVGDGINDAPVLARADVGIAMGALGSDAAIEAADVVIMDDDPLKLALAKRIASKTISIVWQNIIFALTVKAAILLLGALGVAGLGIAIFGDVGVLVIAILNSMRTLSIK